MAVPSPPVDYRSRAQNITQPPKRLSGAAISKPSSFSAYRINQPLTGATDAGASRPRVAASSMPSEPSPPPRSTVPSSVSAITPANMAKRIGASKQEPSPSSSSASSSASRNHTSSSSKPRFIDNFSKESTSQDSISKDSTSTDSTSIYGLRYRPIPAQLSSSTSSSSSPTIHSRDASSSSKPMPPPPSPVSGGSFSRPGSRTVSSRVQQDPPSQRLSAAPPTQLDAIMNSPSSPRSSGRTAKPKVRRDEIIELSSSDEDEFVGESSELLYQASDLELHFGEIRSMHAAIVCRPASISLVLPLTSMRNTQLNVDVKYEQIEAFYRHEELQHCFELLLRQVPAPETPCIKGIPDLILENMKPSFDLSRSKESFRTLRLSWLPSRPSVETDLAAKFLGSCQAFGCTFVEPQGSHPSDLRSVDLNDIYQAVELDQTGQSRRYALRSTVFTRAASSTSRPRMVLPVSKVLEYPKGEKDSVVLDGTDIERLRPDAYLNDNLVDMWVKFLFRERYTSRAPDTYCFSSFFWKKISSLTGDRALRSDRGEKTLKSVSKWTQNINIFEKRCLLIPVCQASHWTLIVVLLPTDEQEGCILWLDSLGGSGTPATFNRVRRYLAFEYRLRMGLPPSQDSESDAFCVKLENLPRGSPTVPVQDNSTDCGVFVLQFIETLLQAPPTPPYPFEPPLDKNRYPMFSPEQAETISTVVKVKRQEIFQKVQELRVLQGEPMLNVAENFFQSALLSDEPIVTHPIVGDDVFKDPDFDPGTKKNSQNLIVIDSSPTRRRRSLRSGSSQDAGVDGGVALDPTIPPDSSRRLLRSSSTARVIPIRSSTTPTRSSTPTQSSTQWSTLSRSSSRLSRTSASAASSFSSPTALPSVVELCDQDSVGEVDESVFEHSEAVGLRAQPSEDGNPLSQELFSTRGFIEIEHTDLEALSDELVPAVQKSSRRTTRAPTPEEGEEHPQDQKRMTEGPRGPNPKRVRQSQQPAIEEALWLDRET